MGRVIKALKHSWNIFNDAPREIGQPGGFTMGHRQARSPARYFNDRSFIGSIYTRMAVDFSNVEFFHALLDDNDVAIEIVRDDLNEAITLNPNIDQTAMALKIDLAMTMFERGHAVVVPVEASMDPLKSASYDIKSLRVGYVSGWGARKVTVMVYDDREKDEKGNPVNGGIAKQVTCRKEDVAIIENPFYSIMNESSGLLQRLLRKLAILDSIDEASGSGKLDLIFQLPYTVRGESRKQQAEQRRAALAEQLKDDELGIGYIDVSEKVIQLNRPVDNKLLDQIEYLMAAVMTELGITPEIMNGSANRDTINNYFDRTIEPIANAVAQEYKRKFLTKTARTRRHSIEIYRDPLKLIPISELAEVADKLIRNRVVTVNEFRPKIGYRPSKEPAANELVNPNMPNDDQTTSEPVEAPPPEEVPNG